MPIKWCKRLRAIGCCKVTGAILQRMWKPSKRYCCVSLASSRKFPRSANSTRTQSLPYRQGKVVGLWMQGSVLGFLKCAFTPEESQVSQGVGEFLRRHRGVGKHACAGM